MPRTQADPVHEHGALSLAYFEGVLAVRHRVGSAGRSGQAMKRSVAENDEPQARLVSEAARGNAP